MTIISYLKNVKKDLYFKPNFWGLLFNPHYIIRRALYNGLKRNANYLNGITLDFGCGHKPYEHLFSVDKYIGTDIEISGHDHANSKVDVYYNGNTIPFEDNYFDSILCSEVLEHLFDPELIISELYRVLKPGGVAIFTTPFVFEEHEVPYDYGRYSSFGIKYLFKKNKFTVIKHEKLNGYVLSICQLWISYIYSLIPNSKIIKAFLSLLIIGPLNLISFLISFLLPKSQKLYLNNLIVVSK